MNINIDFGKIWPFGPRDRVYLTESESVRGYLSMHFAKTGTGRRMVCIPLGQRTGYTGHMDSQDRGPIEFAIKDVSDGEAQPELIAKVDGVDVPIDAFGNTKDAVRAMQLITRSMARNNPGWQRYWWPLLVGVSAFMLLPPLAQMMMEKSKTADAVVQQPAAQVVYAQPPAQPQPVAAPTPPVALKPGSISLEGAVHYGNKNGKTLYVFSDPQCPYCREQEKELSSLEKDYSIYVFPTPFKDGSPEIAKAVMCSKDEQSSWRKVMSGGNVSGNMQCDKARFSEANLNAFRMLGLSATPTLISSDGSVNAGYMTANEIRAWAK